MAYVIRRNDDGKYVAPSGSLQSYTRSLEKARVYPTKDAAEAVKCGNETVIEK